MKSKVITSHEEMFVFIPYRRVLSELFSQEGIMKKLQEVGLIVALEIHWSFKLYVDEGTYGVGPSYP